MTLKAEGNVLLIGRDNTHHFHAEDLGVADDESHAASIAVEQLCLSVGPRATPMEISAIRRHATAIMIATMASELTPSRMKMVA